MARNDTEHEPLRPSRPKSLGDFKLPEEEIEVFSNMDSAELEAFMQEPVTIYAHPPRNDGELDSCTPNVNGINQPIIRGQEITIKRKYVEALARGHQSKYAQQVPDPRQPEHIQMVERKVSSIPFDVRRDTPRGKAWLREIFASL